MEKERRMRSMSDPSDMFESEKEEKKGHGLSHFLHKLPFVSWKHHHHHASCSLEGDDEFYDVEEELKKQEKEELKKQEKKEHAKSEKKEETLKPEKIIVLVNESTDTESDTLQEESVRENHQDQQTIHQEEEVSANNDEDENKTLITEEKEQVSSSSEDHPHHEPPPSPLPPPTKSCLKPFSCLENSKPPPLRKRSISLPEGDPIIVCRLNRHVHFSPDTVDPPPRNCRYREWIERHSSHPKSSINIKHEKRKQQLRQIHSLDINDYLSKGSKRYNFSMISSPMPSLGCDMFL